MHIYVYTYKNKEEKSIYFVILLIELVCLNIHECIYIYIDLSWKVGLDDILLKMFIIFSTCEK